MLSINANSKHKEQAMMYINLINTDKVLYNLICYGIENKHYVLKDGFYSLPDGVTAEQVGYNPGINWALGFTRYGRGYSRETETIRCLESCKRKIAK